MPTENTTDTQLEIGREYPPVGEEAVIEKIRSLLRRGHEMQPGAAQHRGQHPKQHAGLWATFRVADNIDAPYRIGIFAEPRTYTALVRFSNGKSLDDTVSDVHAAAVKVLVPTEGGNPQEQDFIVADHPVFFACNAEQFLEFVIAKGTGQEVSPEVLAILAVAMKKATTSLLAMTFWSQSPFKLGDGAVKYLLRPSAERDRPNIALGTAPDFLRDALREQLTLQKRSATFDFCIHPQTDAAAMPIEDPTVEWKSAPVQLATLTIHPQQFDAPEHAAFFSNLSWNPWHGLPEHRPLGGINRARKVAYPDSSELRHRTTGIAPVALTGREVI